MGLNMGSIRSVVQNWHSFLLQLTDIDGLDSTAYSQDMPKMAARESPDHMSVIVFTYEHFSSPQIQPDLASLLYPMNIALLIIIYPI